MTACAVYKHFGVDGRLLYVGASYAPDLRQASHNSRSDWFGLVERTDVEWFDTRREALAAERKSILTERPIYNKTDAGDMMTASGKAIKLLRSNLQMTQAEFSQAIGVGRSCLSNWEAGNQQLSLDGALAIRRVFGVSLDDLFPDEARATQ